MRPVLFYIGPYPVFSYGVFILLGVITLYATALYPARRAGWTWEDLLPVAAGTLVGGIFGARISHFIVEPSRFFELLDFYSLFRPTTPGNIVGLMVGGYLGGLLVRHSLKLPPLGNVFAPPLAAASVLWRIGCTLGGCCYGKETRLPWSIYLDGADRHPTMVYEGLFNLVALFALLRLRHRFGDNDDLLHLYFTAYAFFRFWLEFLRLYPRIAFGLTGIQYLCLAVLLWQGVRWGRGWHGLGRWREAVRV